MRSVPGPEARGDGKHWQPYDFVIGKKPFVALSPDGMSMAAPSREALSIRDLPSGKERLRLPPPVFGQWCFRPTRALYPWELDDPRKWTEHTVKQASEFLDSVAFGPDGKSLYVAAEDGVRVLDATTGSEIRRLARVPVPEFFSPDGKRFFSKNYILIYDEQHSVPNKVPKAVLYDASTGREQLDLNGVFLGFSRDSRRFAACIETGKDVTIHDSATCEKIITLPLGEVGFPTRDGTLTLFVNGRHLGYSEPWYYESLNLSIYLVDGKSLTWYGLGNLRRQYICDLTPPRD
jgi:hypothetical protein